MAQQEEVKLPNGWILSKLGEYLEFHNGKRKPISLKNRSSRQGEYPYYGATGIIDYLDGYTHDGQYILIGEDGANLLSKSKPLAFLAEGQYWVNNHAHTVKCSLNCPNEYVEKYINSLSLAPWITGSAQPKLNKANLEKIPVPLAPLPEQKRIVEKLDSLLAQVDTIQQRLNNLPNIIKRFRQSVLAAAVSGKLTEQWRGENNIGEWDSKAIKDIASKIGSGSTPKGGQSAYKSEGVPLIRSMNIHFDFIKYDKLAFIDVQQAEKLKNVIVKADDVLLNITGASIGRVNIAPSDFEGGRVNQHVAIIRCKTDMVLPEYLKMQLASPETQKWVQNENYGATRQALTKSMIQNRIVNVPTIEEQTEIVRLVEQYFALADTLEKNLANSKQRVDNLTQSILAKAFKGELVPQDPNDEPADKLLERIKAARLEAEKLEKAAKASAKKAAKATKATKAKPKAKGTA